MAERKLQSEVSSVYDDEELLEGLDALVERLGRRPTAAELNEAPETASYATYKSRFGGLSEALDEIGVESEVSPGPRKVSASECREALRTVAEESGADLTMDEYDAAKDESLPSSQTIAKTLGDSSWNQAKEQAGLKTNPRGPREEFTRADCRRALSDVASRLGSDSVSMPEYRRNRDEDMPSEWTVMDKLGDGSWDTAISEVGLDRSRPGPRQGSFVGGLSRGSALDALERVADDLGRPPSRAEYDDARRDDDPVGKTVANRFGSWAAAKDELRSEWSPSKRD